MINWLGQEINVGDWVYRGARHGNGSEYKIGVVQELFPEDGKIKVHWEYRQNWEEKPYKVNQPGRCSINVVVAIDKPNWPALK